MLLQRGHAPAWLTLRSGPLAPTAICVVLFDTAGPGSLCLTQHASFAVVLLYAQARAPAAQGRRLLLNMRHVIRNDERFAGKAGGDGPDNFRPERWLGEDARRTGAWCASPTLTLKGTRGC